VLQPEPMEVWTALVHRFGLPGLPEWADAMMQVLRENGRITSVDSIGCSAAVILATSDELLTWMGDAVRRGELSFPVSNGPIRWNGGLPMEGLRPGFRLTQGLPDSV
jgi:hypothetical protein